MCNENNINVPVDCIFTVRLETQVGSTGYSWALAHMPDSVNLLDISFETSHSYINGCTETQVFTFVAVEKDENYILFNLIRPWEPENVAEQKKFTVTIEAEDSTVDELQSTAGCKKFATFSDSCGSTGVAAMYMGLGVQGVSGGVQALYMCPTVMKYMGPPVMKYMGPPVMKYMGPPVMKYMGPPVLKYMAPVEDETKE